MTSSALVMNLASSEGGMPHPDHVGGDGPPDAERTLVVMVTAFPARRFIPVPSFSPVGELVAARLSAEKYDRVDHNQPDGRVLTHVNRKRQCRRASDFRARLMKRRVERTAACYPCVTRANAA